QTEDAHLDHLPLSLLRSYLHPELLLLRSLSIIVMGKKGKEDAVPSPAAIVNKDIMQRLNFMYQASVYLSSLGQPESSTSTADPALRNEERGDEGRDSLQKRRQKKIKNVKRRAKMTAPDLARTYVGAMKVVASRTTVRIDPAVKRTLCPACDGVLVPGHTVSVRVRPSKTHTHTMAFTCKSCGATRRIPAPPSISGSSSPPPSLQQPSGDDLTPNPNANPGRRKRRRPARAKRPPLAARADAGHVVVRGADALLPAETADGDGIWVT
ncbi:unnamed protein product, partial [Mycena citricolor]